MLDPAAAPFALFDDNLAHGGDLLLERLAERIEIRDPAQLPQAFETIEGARSRGRWVALAAAYELGYALEARLGPLRHDGAAPLLTAWIFHDARRLTSLQTAAALDRAVAALPEHRRIAGVAAMSPGIAADAYLASVERIRQLIDAGDCYQVNFTFPLRGEIYGDPLALYVRLRAAQPVRYGAFVRDGATALLSRSPELFVERHRDALVCRPMKGTAPREKEAAELASSGKDRAENVMIVDLIRNDLGRLAPPGGVRVTGLCDIEDYPSLRQMTSTVRAQPVHADLQAVLRALFPCGSITGAPKIRAMQIIRELEAEPRGVYCGALGWIAPDGDFRFSVPIRTLALDTGGRATLAVGSGIVADSEPAAEWAECLLKARFVTALGPTFGLIETLRCEPEAAEPYPLLGRHLGRLARSAAHFGFPHDAAAARAALARTAANLAGPHRVRMQLDADGRLDIRSAPLASLAPGPRPTVVVSATRVASSNPLARHKTTVRAIYDMELERITQDGHFDTLFFNERDELVEGARSSVFVTAADGTLLTPPLASGALDGVFRRKLLDEGRAREQRLTRDDLRDAPALHVANALRGLVRVDLVQSSQQGPGRARADQE